MIARLLVLLGFFAVAGWAAPTSVADQQPALQDQYGETSGLTDFAQQPVLAIVVSTRKLRWIGRWEAAIRPQVPDLVSIRVADVTDEPPPNFATAAGLLRERVPEGISVLIDMNNEWANRYGLDTREPCLLLFDSDHRIVAQFRGRPRKALLNDVIGALRNYFPPPSES